MLFRDDLDQANRRVENLELELREARENRDHLAGRPAPVAPAPVPVIERRRITTTLSLVEWWPVATLALTLVGYIAASAWAAPNDLDTAADFPAQLVFASAFVASALCGLEVLLRSRRGHRGVLGRMLIVLACIAAVPVGLFAFLVGGGILGVVAPICMISVCVYKGIRWLATGKSWDD